jgi:APA family basic amino acid/polyamine antiporter
MKSRLSSGNNKLIRAVGRWDLIALAINGVVGTSIFGLPASVAALTGAWSPLACLLSGAIVMLIVLCFAEAATLFVGTGGPYLYAREAFGSTVGLAGGWMMWLTRATAFAANSNLMVSSVAYFVPACGQGSPRAAILIGVTGVLTWINYRGIRQGAVLGDVLAIAKLAPIAAFVVVGLFFVDPRLVDTSFRPSHVGFAQAVLLYLYAYSGFEFAAIPAGEAKAPKRDLPVAMITALLTAAALYAGIQYVCVGTLPGLAQSKTAVVDASARFLGPVGGTLIGLAVLASISGNLSGITLVSPRLTYALAADGLLPSWLAAVHARYRTPYLSIFLFGALTLGLALSGTFEGMLKISAVARIIPYALTCLAIPVLRKKYPDAPERFKLKGGATIPVLAIVLCVWLLTQSPGRDLMAAAVALVVGYVLYGANRMWRRARQTPEA